LDFDASLAENGRAQKFMNRVDVIQKTIDRIGAQNYLEIGVSTGNCFLQIKARRKVAVDPKFRLPAKMKWKLRWRNRSAQYYELPSNDFFQKIQLPHGFDVAFIDGLHTYSQSLKDVDNALARLSDRGVIIMHDCNPTTATMAYPAESHSHAASLGLPGWNNAWTGDVWKTICHLRSQRADLNAFVLDCDYGLGIVTRGPVKEPLKLSAAELDALNYDDLAANRQRLLNLKPEGYFADFLRSLRS
jgi:hypothetical protein